MTNMNKKIWGYGPTNLSKAPLANICKPQEHLWKIIQKARLSTTRVITQPIVRQCIKCKFIKIGFFNGEFKR